MPNRLLPPACWSTAKQRIRHSPGFGIATKIVRCEFGNANLGGELLDDVPDQLFRYSFAPSSTSATHMPEKLSRFNSGGLCPFVEQGMHPIRDGNGSNVASLSAQVHDGPMPFALLQVAESQFRELMATESTGQQKGKQRAITFALQALAVWRLPECMRLFGGQPVAEPDAELLYALDPPNSRSQVGAQKAAI